MAGLSNVVKSAVILLSPIRSLSERNKAILEVSLGLSIVFGYAWFINPLDRWWLHAICYSIFLGLLFYSKYSRRESWRDLGFRWDNCISSGKILLAMTLISMIGLSIIWSQIYPLNLQFYRQGSFWLKLTTKPFWALFQQYIALAFFFRRLREVFFPHHYLAIFFSAVLFSSVHIPNFPLMIFCFPGGFYWAWVYQRHPNIFTIAMSHAVIAVLCSNVLLVYSAIGPAADVGRWTKKSLVYDHIDTVNGEIIPNQENPRIVTSKSDNSIVVQGWVVGVEGELEKIFIRMDGNDYSVSYGMDRKDVAVHYRNPAYRYCGFSVEIPISGIDSGLYALRLKVLMKNRHYYIYPGQRVWVEIQ